MPEESQMSEFDRRQVQDALRRLGYYDSVVDALFGPETRAADSALPTRNRERNDRLSDR